MLGQNGQYSLSKLNSFTPEGREPVPFPPSGLTLNIYSLNDLLLAKEALSEQDRESLEQSKKLDDQWETRVTEADAKKNGIIQGLLSKSLLKRDGKQLTFLEENRTEISNQLTAAGFADRYTATTPPVG